MNKSLSGRLSGTDPPPEKPRLSTKEDRDKVHAVDSLVDCEEEYGEEVGIVWPIRENPFLQKYPYIIGYAFLAGVAIMASLSNLMLFVISFLFLYLISDILTNDLRRYVPFVPKALLFSILYVLVVSLVVVLTYSVIPRIIKQLPIVANQVQLQAIQEYKAASQRWKLQEYVDPDEVRGMIGKATTAAMRIAMDTVTPLYTGIVHLIFALVINLLLYHDVKKVERVFNRRPGSLMTFLYSFTAIRAKIFYAYFKRVMGGQIIIALINTVISSVVVLMLDLPYPILMLNVIFFTSLLPIVGNLISNTILTINAFVSIGPWAAFVCLILLVVIHKLEYFLNSRIIGGIVKLPMVITLGALIICEVLFGIVGMMLAVPLLLYMRHELEHIPSAAGDFLQDVEIRET